MSSYIQVRQEAERRFRSGDSMGALSRYAMLLDRHPHDHAVRLHVGDALHRLGLRQRAGQVYAGVALGHLKAGRPLQGVLACCALLTVKPDSTPALDMLSSMYGRGAAKLQTGASPAQSSAPPLHEDLGIAPPTAPGELIRQLTRKASTPPDEPSPEAHPPLPILSDLEGEDLLGVLAQVRRRRFHAGEVLIQEGDIGRSFFLLVHGGVYVHRKDSDGVEQNIATLGPGTILGEIAVVTGSRRTATVRAISSAEAIEVPMAALEQIAGDRRGVAEALDRFTRDRLIQDVLSSSRLFRPFWPDRVGEVLPLFQSRDFGANEVLIYESQRGEGLFLILSGEARVTRTQGAQEVEVARVGTGDSLGETALLTDRPATATVTASRPTMTLFLPREAFERLISRYPEVHAGLQELESERKIVNAFLLDDEEFFGAMDDESMDDTLDDTTPFFL